MIHPDTEVRFINKIKGYGVVATKRIPKGTITWVQDDLDQIFTASDLSNLSPAAKSSLEKYSFTNGSGQKVLCWDNGKFVNHSFNPNCISTAYDFEIAVRDIFPGEELTDDYGYLNVEAPFEPYDEGFERKIVYPDDILRNYATWDQLLKDNLELIFENKQPLIPYLDVQIWQEFKEAVALGMPLRSIKECYYDPDAVVKVPYL